MSPYAHHPSFGRKAGVEIRQRIADQITAFTHMHTRPPTLRELMPLVGCASLGHLHYHLKVMEQQGTLQQLPHSARRYIPLDIAAAACTRCEQLQAEVARLQARLAELEGQP